MSIEASMMAFACSSVHEGISRDLGVYQHPATTLQDISAPHQREPSNGPELRYFASFEGCLHQRLGGWSPNILGHSREWMEVVCGP